MFDVVYEPFHLIISFPHNITNKSCLLMEIRLAGSERCRSKGRVLVRGGVREPHPGEKTSERELKMNELYCCIERCGHLMV